MEFKVGDVVECLTGSFVSSTGDVFTISRIDSDGDCWGIVRGSEACKKPWNIKLVDSNPMPELEAGMVVEVELARCNESLGKFLYVNNGFMVGLDGTGGWQDIGDAIEIVSVYRENATSYKMIGSGLGAPIWTRTPEKTELEKKKESLIEKANELIKQAEEL